ncbi:phosphoribosyltransferase [bacterium]|nr:phosphoribosyltransferase [bacterium]
MTFADREEAARLLAEKLKPYAGKNPLVLAIPRGAVAMGRIVADALGGELDVVLVRKIGAPSNPEYAVGAVDESGHIQINPTSGYSRDDAWVLEEAERQVAALRDRRRRYTPVRSPIDPAGRVVIVIDDGIATGSTMLAALAFVREHGAAKIVAAVGVAHPEGVRRLESVADEVVAGLVSPDLTAVGSFFREFGQVSDAEVVALLGAANA